MYSINFFVWVVLTFLDGTSFMLFFHRIWTLSHMYLLSGRWNLHLIWHLSRSLLESEGTFNTVCFVLASLKLLVHLKETTLRRRAWYCSLLFIIYIATCNKLQTLLNQFTLKSYAKFLINRAQDCFNKEHTKSS